MVTMINIIPIRHFMLDVTLKSCAVILFCHIEENIKRVRILITDTLTFKVICKYLENSTVVKVMVLNWSPLSYRCRF